MKTPQSDAGLKEAQERIDQTARAIFVLARLPDIDAEFIYIAPGRIQIHIKSAEAFFNADYAMRSGGWVISKDRKSTYKDVIITYMLGSAAPVDVEFFLPTALYWGIIARNEELNELLLRIRLEDKRGSS